MSMHLRYSGTCYSRNNVKWKVDILQANDVPFANVGDLDLSSNDALVIEWPVIDKEEVIVGSSATLNIISPGDRTYEDLYTIIPGNIRMDVYCEDQLYWSGTLDPEFYSEPYERLDNYVVTLTFSDFGVLDRITYDLNGAQPLLTIVERAIAGTNIKIMGIDYDTLASTYFAEGSKKATIDNLSIRSDNFTDEEGGVMSMRDVIIGILQPLGLRMVQRAGKVYIYDLNGLYNSGRSQNVVWMGDSSTLSVDKVANNVRITFSPYTQSDLQATTTNNGKIVYGGNSSPQVVNLGTANPSDPDYGEFYTFLNDYNFNTSQSIAPGMSSLMLARSFNVFCDPKGSGIDYHANSYFRVEPVIGNSERVDGIYGGFRVGCCSLDSGDTRLVGIQPSKVDQTVFNLPLMRTQKVFIPRMAAEEASKYRLKITLKMLMDVRYNPFEEEGDYNEGAACEEVKYNTAWAFVPANITLRDEEQGSVVRHYSNVGITASAGWGHVDLDYSGWQPGEPTGHNAWLAFYEDEKQWEQPAIGGWRTNRHNFGRPDTESRKPQSAEAWPKPYEWEVAASFKSLNDGQYIPYPAQGGWLEITIYQGVNCYAYGEESIFGTTTKWTELSLYDKVRWLLYQAPQVEIVRSDLTLESAKMEDVEYTGWLHPNAKDEITIDTICGTANIAIPSARGIYLETSSGNQIRRLARAGVADHPERLLINTLYSQYASRRTMLSGVMTLDTSGLGVFTETNQQDKKLMIKGEVQDLMSDTTEVTLVELRPDEYQAV